ncbi:MAG: hypothetical protein WCA63_07490 [Gallionella sp.]
MAILLIAIIGAVAFLLSALKSSTLQIARDKVTADALAKAKDALISYAVTYGDTHPGQAYGYLPSPDPNGIAGLNGEGSSETWGNANVSAIGRLPWKTLDLPPLRDGNGECLWYAVSGTYKNNPPPTYTLMNWDNYGLFQIFAATGVPLTGATPDLYAVAAVFSPGVALSGQNRSSDGSAPICGGNYTASNYLDQDNSIFANNAAPSASANALSNFYIAGATANINDQIIYITRSDIFNAIKKRNDFATFVSSMLSDATANLSLPTLPTPVFLTFTNTTALTETPNNINIGNLYIGKIPKAYFSPPHLNQYQNWQDNLQYAKCTPASGSCLTVNGSSCRGVVIFTGERNATQTRITSTNKNAYSNYLEGSIYGQFGTGGTSYAGASLYNPASTSTDVLACVL